MSQEQKSATSPAASKPVVPRQKFSPEDMTKIQDVLVAANLNDLAERVRSCLDDPRVTFLPLK